METPEQISRRSGAYLPDAWRTWSLDDLRKWAELLERRWYMRSDTEEGKTAAAKDRKDSQAYKAMLAIRIKELQ